ncbi:MAG TPA: ROK family protein, partial [Ilumatobacteraceae bacterium]|nr:ROK family protein [Ilumatobacteraceae bacterium]
PSPLVHLAAERAVVLALEIAVDSLAVAVVGLGGTVLDLVRVDRPRGHLTVDDIVADLAELAAGVSPAWRSDALIGIGVAVVGIVRRDDGFVSAAPNLGWRDVPLGAALATAFGTAAPIVVANEADLGALAEHRRGAAAGSDDVVFLSAEVGLGGGLIIGGRPLTGIAGFGGEVGHIPVNPVSGATCRCGSVGCWETEVGEQALLARAGRPVGGGRAAVEAVVADAAAGDARALAALTEVGRWLGIGLAGLVNMLNPARVVLGGHLARVHGFIAATVEDVLDERALGAPRALVAVVPARLGVDAAVLGAAELAFEPLLADPASTFQGTATTASTGLLGHRRRGTPDMSKLSRTHRGPRQTARGGPRLPVRRSAALMMGAALVLVAACGDDDDDDSDAVATTVAGGSAPAAGTAGSAPAGTGGGGDCVVGVSWNNYQEERWAKWDEPALKAAIEAGGGSYVSNDAKSSAETQASNLENLISQGANVLIVLAQDGTAIKPAVASATEAGVPVIAYDRLIEDENALYITFDNVRVGEMEAQAVFDLVPEGRYVIVKGNSADANADFLRDGYETVIGDAVAAGDIEIVSETYTDNWDPALAQSTMEQVLTAENNDIDAVLSENDGMAGGVVAALEAQGLAGQIPVSGQDGDQAALNRIALGTQTVDVWKDARELGTTAGEAAVALCADPDVASVPGTAPFTTPGGIDVTSILLEPIPITQDNLNVVLDAGWISQEDLCAGVEAGSVEACG